MIRSRLEIEDLDFGGAFVIKPYWFEDDRGLFVKSFTDEMLARRGVPANFAEEFMSVSRKGVIRGFHYQRGEHSQAKLVWCLKGEIFDVIVDLRRKSRTYGKHKSIVLSSENMHTLYIPQGFAHAFKTVSDEACMLYKMSRPYSPQDECGIIYNDEDLNVPWPEPENATVSEKDGKWPRFSDCIKFD
ncbi:MAG: dTDP-4-dehydrorhamnose 3,5-epimerase [Pseudomonadota bacterium]